MKPIIAVSQVFGNFPINGMRNSTPDKYVFKFPSFVTSYSLMIISFMGIAFAAALNRAIHSMKDYKHFVGIIGFIISTLATFTWNFCDLLIILVSIGLAERYKHLNEVVNFKISNNSTERINWWKIRNYYVIMNELVKEADNIVSPLILISCCMNVYQICVHTSEVIRYL
ncbi:hypothetical protein HCN44_010227 [Aphidius gifuensis]|uniref:Gustatory receptor n=1 Tax=Aphidius gifuensis TaxID=684658 RepID=A0A835CRT0_APHGI|nr:hypothetical protein HCN44_010227 [Aphidius gifuensis]